LLSASTIAWITAGCVLPALAVAWAAGFLARRWAPRWGLVDHPGERKQHAASTPLGGGIAIALGVVLPLAAGQLALAFADPIAADGGSLGRLASSLGAEFVIPHLAGLAEQLPRLWLLLAAAAAILALGLADDARGVDWRARLIVQIAVAAVVVWGLGWRVTLFLEAPLLAGLLSVLWIVALVNAFNMLDNMDGLSAGVAAIAAAVLAATLLSRPNPESPASAEPQLFVAGFLLLLFGALAGFLWHNRTPARLFMGDAGSYFVGFSLAVATMQATYTGVAGPARHAVLAPLLVMALPLYDMASVILIRLRRGMSPFAADRNHFSHRLVELGMTPRLAVRVIYLATLTCGLGAMLLHQVDVAGAVAVVLITACTLGLIALLESAARRR